MALPMSYKQCQGGVFTQVIRQLVQNENSCEQDRATFRLSLVFDAGQATSYRRISLFDFSTATQTAGMTAFN